MGGISHPEALAGKLRGDIAVPKMNPQCSINSRLEITVMVCPPREF
jgi:hypothetical protein